MNTETEMIFLNKARRLFTDSAAGLDARILARLREARARAVEAAERRQPFWRIRRWTLPAGAIAVVFALVAGGLVWWNLGSQPAVPFATTNNEDMAIVLSSDNLDMYADMDFYRWLQAQQQQQNESPTDAGANNNG
ncbi:MAG: hypothetical protein WCC11_01550 [Gammaproteobacteria bacterium]